MNASKVSLRDGYWFCFDAVAPRMSVFVTASTGREIVLVDDEILSDKRTLFSRKTIHEFEHQGSAWAVTVAVSSLRTDEVVCTLIRDGEQVAEATRAHLEGRKSLWRPFFVGILSASLLWFVLYELGFLR